MSESMVEKVAKAICRANVLSMMKLANMQVASKVLDAEVERLWRDDMDGARAAIETMREPDDMMLTAGRDAAVPRTQSIGAIYTACIDAALSDPSPSP